MLVIGSEALRRYDKDRSVSDIDIIGTLEEIEYYISTLDSTLVRNDLDEIIQLRKDGELKYEFFIATDDNVMGDYLRAFGYSEHELHYAGKYILYSIKKGHLFHTFNICKFKKHIKDYEYLHDLCKGYDMFPGLTSKQSNETENRVGKRKLPKLNKDSKEFFEESSGPVTYRFIHDDLHDIMAHGDRPRYTLMQKIGQTSAYCYESLWNDMSFKHKVECVLEEAYVIALERRIIPAYFDKRVVNIKIALDWSLMRICTNLCSGWFRQFACDNHVEIRRSINLKYPKIFFEAYRNGKIKEGKGKLIQN